MRRYHKCSLYNSYATCSKMLWNSAKHPLFTSYTLQGCLTQLLEGHSPKEFRSNSIPTNIPVVFKWVWRTWLAGSGAFKVDAKLCRAVARAGATGGLGLSRPLTQDECENRFYLWNIMFYLKNTVAKWIGFLALIWCYYSKNVGQSVSQSRILIVTSDTQTSRASGSTKCRHYAALLTKLKVWWNNFLMFNRGLDYRS